MSGALYALAIAAALFAVLLWLLRPQRQARAPGRPRFDRSVEELLPVHYRYFPQVRQIFSEPDQQYLRERVPPPVAREILRERRAVARRFLVGLYGDFSNLERLARLVASFSPEVSREQEIERLVLGLKFRLLYFWVQLRLATGSVPLVRIEHLTDFVGKLTGRMEHAMAAVNAISVAGLDSRLRA